jgi:hypothetical protein
LTEQEERKEKRKRVKIGISINSRKFDVTALQQLVSIETVERNKNEAPGLNAFACNIFSPSYTHSAAKWNKYIKEQRKKQKTKVF